MHCQNVPVHTEYCGRVKSKPGLTAASHWTAAASSALHSQLAAAAGTLMTCFPSWRSCDSLARARARTGKKVINEM